MRKNKSYSAVIHAVSHSVSGVVSRENNPKRPTD